MGEREDILALVRKRAASKILFLPHAVSQMSRPERMISPDEVRACVETGEVVEDYPDDPRGHSCLLLGRGAEGRPVHVVCSPKEDFLAIITAYLPNPNEWESDLKARKNR